MSKRPTLAQIAAERLAESAPPAVDDHGAQLRRVIADPRATPKSVLEATKALHRLEGRKAEPEAVEQDGPTFTPEQREAIIARALESARGRKSHVTREQYRDDRRRSERAGFVERVAEIGPRLDEEPEDIAAAAAETTTTGAEVSDGPVASPRSQPARIKWPVPVGADPWAGFPREREDFLSGVVAASPSRYAEVVRP